MAAARRAVFMVFAGIIGGWSGYWLGHLFGWSENADWPTSTGGGVGAILLAIVLAVAAALLVGRLLSMGSTRRAGEPSTTSRQPSSR